MTSLVRSSYSNYIWESYLFGVLISFLWLALSKWKIWFRVWTQRDESLCDPLNNLSKMWIIYLDKKKCCSPEKDLLSCPNGKEIREMIEREQKIVLFMGASSIHLQCPHLSSCTVWSPAVDQTHKWWMWLSLHILTMSKWLSASTLHMYSLRKEGRTK